MTKNNVARIKNSLYAGGYGGGGHLEFLGSLGKILGFGTFVKVPKL